MGIIKCNTQFIPCQHPKFRLKGAHPDWEMHPSWISGIEALDAYNHWVSEVVMPIAFQWIEEHKAEVYASVAEENKDDVGVVIAAAFDLVKELSSYQNGLKRYEEALAAYDQAIRLNPNDDFAYYGKGIALRTMGKTNEAEQAFEKARQLGYNGST